MAKPINNFSAYVMFAGGEEVPEQTSLTKESAIAYLSEASGFMGIDTILHIESDDGMVNFRVENVTQEIVTAAIDRTIDFLGYEEARQLTYVDGAFQFALTKACDDAQDAAPLSPEQRADRYNDEQGGL